MRLILSEFVSRFSSRRVFSLEFLNEFSDISLLWRRRSKAIAEPSIIISMLESNFFSQSLSNDHLETTQCISKVL